MAQRRRAAVVPECAICGDEPAINTCKRCRRPYGERHRGGRNLCSQCYIPFREAVQGWATIGAIGGILAIVATVLLQLPRGTLGDFLPRLPWFIVGGVVSGALIGLIGWFYQTRR